MASAQLAPIAKDFIVDKVPVRLLGLTLPALQWALVLDRVLNGLARPIVRLDLRPDRAREHDARSRSASKRSRSS